MLKRFFVISLLIAIFNFNVFADISEPISHQNKRSVKVIGISVDNRVNDKYSRLEYSSPYLIVEGFRKACVKNNVIFVMLPYDNIETVKDYVSKVDGLFISGGGDDRGRFVFDLYFLKEILRKNKPVLGTCYGQQLMHAFEVARKQNIKLEDIEDYASFVNSSLIDLRKVNEKHHHYQDHRILSHSVTISKNSLLHGIVKKDEIEVNSHHNFILDEKQLNTQALISVARDPSNGYIEALEKKHYKNFFLTVQWHPEYLLTEYDVKILQSFCNSVEGR